MIKNDNFMDDCVHLRACRRFAKLVKRPNSGGRMPVGGRHCDETCFCYASAKQNRYVTVDQAVQYAVDGADYIRGGYSEYTIYASQDFDDVAKTLNELLDEAEDETRERVLSEYGDDEDDS